MKKFSLALTILTAVSFAAHAQTVGSANVMGYTKLTTPTAGSFDLLALTQFSDGTTNNTLSIQDVISNLSDLNSDGLGSGATGADKLYVYNGSGYDQYALFQPVAGAPYWASISEGGWTSGLEFLGVNASSATIDRGTACWLETGIGGSATNALSSGNVYLDATLDITVGSGFSLLAYPYSSSVNLTNMTITGAVGDGLGSGAANADKLYAYNGSGYDQYALFQPAAGDPYWASISEGGWTSGLEFLGVNPANVTVELGAGFWFETATGKTIGFEKIYNIN